MQVVLRGFFVGKLRKKIMEEKKQPIKNNEIIHTCGACRHTVKKGEQVAVMFPIVSTPKGNKISQVMVCNHCGVLTALPEGSVQLPQIEQPKIIIPK